jgi:Iap family predicted aminopeptidase
MLDTASFPRLDPDGIRDVLLRVCAVGSRFVGGEGERAARELIVDEFREAGLSEVRSEPFEVPGYRGEASACEVVPGGPLLPSTGLQFTAGGTVEAEAVYVGRPQAPEDIVALDELGITLRDRIVVLNSYFSYLYIEEILARGAVGLVVISEVRDGIIGNYSALMYPPPQRPLPIPGVTVELEAGHRLLSLMTAAPRRLRLTHLASYVPTETANVVGVLPGASDELVVIGGHYDTQLESHGYCDNGSGISALVNIARSWRGSCPHRTVVFVAFGDEEHGSPGATDFCRRHREELARTVGMVNLDALGWAYPTAKRNLFVDPSLERFAVEGAAALGWAPDVIVEGNEFPGYDCNPFLDGGVPTAWFWRYPPQHPYYHSAGDTPDLLDYAMITETAEVSAFTAFRLANEPELNLGRARPSRTWLDFAPEPDRITR